MSLAELTTLLETLNVEPSENPHGSNILTKARGGRLSSAQVVSLETTIPKYLALHATALNYEAGLGSLAELLGYVEDYYDLIKTPHINCFSHQSDYVSSFLPELLCVLLRRVIRLLPVSSSDLVVRAQKDISIEYSFDVSGGGRIIEKRKRVDVAILSTGTLLFNGRNIDFAIPALCAEVKTNVDKTMLAGIEASVETLKRTFPRALYYAVGEYSDFEIEAQNYASTGIDEILIVRNQKRSVVRRNPSARNPISEQLLTSFLNEVKTHIESAVITQSDLAARMRGGRLT